MTERLLSIPQTAKYLGTTVWCVRSLIWEKKIPFLHLGHRHLIDPNDLEKFIARAKQ
jgi:excisionase family DNA binding protein